jgi:hypothetical protein
MYLEKMKHTYYFGQYDPENQMFYKNINVEKWQKAKSGKELVSSRTELRYFTADRCFILNKDTGAASTEKFGSIQLISAKELLVESEINELPFFPVQYTYYNKQVHTIQDYKTTDGQIITFSDYVENHTHFREIYSSSSISSSSL